MNVDNAALRRFAVGQIGRGRMPNGRSSRAISPWLNLRGVWSSRTPRYSLQPLSSTSSNAAIRSTLATRSADVRLKMSRQPGPAEGLEELRRRQLASADGHRRLISPLRSWRGGSWRRCARPSRRIHSSAAASSARPNRVAPRSSHRKLSAVDLSRRARTQLFDRNVLIRGRW